MVLRPSALAGSRGRAPRLPLPKARPIELLIDRIGTAGDGTAQSPAGLPIHIPFTLPGERIATAWSSGPRATYDAILTPSPDRVVPPCPHFGVCGGCALQHWADGPYAAWKSDLVRKALVRAGFADPAMAPLARTPPHARRRMDFAVQRGASGIRLGLHQAHTGTIVDLQTCVILHPALTALFAPLRPLLSSLNGIRKGADLAASFLPTGIDLLIRADAPASAPDRLKLAAFAHAHGIARIAWAVGQGPTENAALLQTPTIAFAGTQVAPPPGAFLQASPQGEAAIVAAVLAGLPARLSGRALILELYAGIGTLSFPLAARGRVRAFEGNADSAAALRRAAGGTRVEAITRDLARQPLQAPALKDAAAIVLDPPFAGAAAQMPALAASGRPVIYVSCNPGALARDAAILADAGYVLDGATPIDQFLWSAQVEAVCVFTRAPIGGRAARVPVRRDRGGSASG